MCRKEVAGSKTGSRVTIFWENWCRKVRVVSCFPVMKCRWGRLGVRCFRNYTVYSWLVRQYCLHDTLESWNVVYRIRSNFSRPLWHNYLRQRVYSLAKDYTTLGRFHKIRRGGSTLATEERTRPVNYKAVVTTTIHYAFDCDSTAEPPRYSHSTTYIAIL